MLSDIILNEVKDLHPAHVPWLQEILRYAQNEKLGLQLSDGFSFFSDGTQWAAQNSLTIYS